MAPASVGDSWQEAMMPTLMSGREGTWRFLPAVCVVVLASLFAGSSGALQRGADRTRHDDQITSTGVHSPNEHAAVATPSPADATVQLEALLGQHSVLAADLMRGRVRGDEDFAHAADAALSKNTDAMGQLVGSLLGEPAAAKFRSYWSAHITALFSYASALATHDSAARDRARTTLASFESELADFFVEASQGRLPRDAAQAAVAMHIDHLLTQADAYASGDFAKADQSYREGYAHTYGLGKTIAAALLGPDKAAVLDSPVWRLRSELGRLLGEHAELIISGTRAGVANWPDFAAAADAVNGNTRDLTGAMETLFGTPAATTFQSLWADHVDQIMSYTAGVVTRDTKRRDEAVARLNTFESRFADFLDSATGGRLPSAELSKALLSHDQMLLRQVDAFAAKDYQKAYDLAYTTYQHMSDVAGQLAEAFGATIASRLPTGGPQTGQGGMAGLVERR
jgi:hypothetical protein